MGRPSSYNLSIVERICSEIASGKSLNKIVKEDWCVDYTTVCKWLRTHDEFAQMYACAREDQGQYNGDLINDIAAETPNVVEGKVDSGWVAWQRNRIDAAKFVAAKLKPRVYGDRTHATIEARVKISKPKTDEELMLEIAELSQELGGKYQVVEMFDEGESE